MLDCLLDGVLDSLKLLPYLFVAFLVLEFLEHKFSKKSEKYLEKYNKFGPVIGGVLGALPQCGFSTMASNLFSNGVITMGTLIAIFLSTSDEMIAVMFSEQADLRVLFGIVGFKVIIGVIVGFLVDLLYHKKNKDRHHLIEEHCHHDDCHCEENGIFKSSLVHTLKIFVFIFAMNIFLNIIIYYIGEEQLSNLLLRHNIFTYFLASLLGLIPNCASSVIITELYISDLISIGTLLSGLLTGSGLGILLLFKENKNVKENASILLIIYFVGVLIGFIADLIIR